MLVLMSVVMADQPTGLNWCLNMYSAFSVLSQGCLVSTEFRIRDILILNHLTDQGFINCP
jgi:hypothetical protein